MRASIGKVASIARQVLGGLEVGERHDGRVAVLEAHQARASDDSRREGVLTIEHADQLPSLAGVRSTMRDDTLTGTRQDTPRRRRARVVHVESGGLAEQAGHPSLVLAE